MTVGASRPIPTMPLTLAAIACWMPTGKLAGSSFPSYTVYFQPIALAAASTYWAPTATVGEDRPTATIAIVLPLAAGLAAVGGCV